LVDGNDDEDEDDKFLYKIKVYPRYLVTSEAHKTSSWSYQLKKAQKRRDLV
jgi:hypothetical protein